MAPALRAWQPLFFEIWRILFAQISSPWEPPLKGPKGSDLRLYVWWELNSTPHRYPRVVVIGIEHNKPDLRSRLLGELTFHPINWPTLLENAKEGQNPSLAFQTQGVTGIHPTLFRFVIRDHKVIGYTNKCYLWWTLCDEQRLWCTLAFSNSNTLLRDEWPESKANLKLTHTYSSNTTT